MPAKNFPGERRLTDLVAAVGHIENVETREGLTPFITVEATDLYPTNGIALPGPVETVCVLTLDQLTAVYDAGFTDGSTSEGQR